MSSTRALDFAAPQRPPRHTPQAQARLTIPAFDLRVHININGVETELGGSDTEVFCAHCFLDKPLNPKMSQTQDKDGVFRFPKMNIEISDETLLKQGPNIRLGVCMNGMRPMTQVPEQVQTDCTTKPEQFQSVIFSNVFVGICEMLACRSDSGVECARYKPLHLTTQSPEDGGWQMVYRISIPSVQDVYALCAPTDAMPEEFQARNWALVKQVDAVHVPINAILDTLRGCSSKREQAHMQVVAELGCPVDDARGLYVKVPLGSFMGMNSRLSPADKTPAKLLQAGARIDATVFNDAEPADDRVDIAQWDAIMHEMIRHNAESHMPHVVSAALHMVSSHCAQHGTDIADVGLIERQISACAATPEGRAGMVAQYIHGLQRRNEAQFLYTSDASISGFDVIAGGSRLAVAPCITGIGEKQNSFGKEPLTCAMHTERVVEAELARLTARMQSDKRVAKGDSGPDRAALATKYAAIERDYETRYTELMIARSNQVGKYDCEDGCQILSFGCNVFKYVDKPRLQQWPGNIINTKLYPSSTAAYIPVAERILAGLHSAYAEGAFKTTSVMCFAAGAHMQDGTAAYRSPNLSDDVRNNYNNLLAAASGDKVGGHACLFNLTDAANVQALQAGAPDVGPAGRGARTGDLVTVRLLNEEVTAHESTNPVDVIADNYTCVFRAKCNNVALDKKLRPWNTEMPLTTARSIISNLVSNGVNKQFGCETASVTYAAPILRDPSSFYASLISTGPAFVFTKQGPHCRPTAVTSHIGDPQSGATHLLVKGHLVPTVILNGKTYSELDFIRMIVSAATPLMPPWKSQIRWAEKSGFRMSEMKYTLPVKNQGACARVLCRTPCLPMQRDAMTDRHYRLEEQARLEFAKKFGPDTVVVVESSMAFCVYLPKKTF